MLDVDQVSFASIYTLHTRVFRSYISYFVDTAISDDHLQRVSINETTLRRQHGTRAQSSGVHCCNRRIHLNSHQRLYLLPQKHLTLPFIDA